VSKPLKLEKKRFGEFVDVLLSRYWVFGPVEVDGVARFRRIESADALKPGFPGTVESPKGVFFPQMETMLTGDRNEAASTSGPEEPIAIVGARPCDARALLMLDRVFGTGERTDPYWTRRYRDALVVVAGCTEPMAGCFCNWLGSGPFGRTGADIMLTDTGDAFVVEACSEKGSGFLEQAKGLSLSEASGEDQSKAEGVRSAAESAMPEKTDVSSLKEILDRSWDSPLWDRLAERCLSCAACAYLCPTCHCFDIQDEKLPGTGRYRRIRIWDSCMAPLFTKEASGHNPRPAGRERLRQRVMHKFNYFVEACNETACVGCGRCVRSCPVNIDIREVLAEFVNAG